MTQNNVRSWPNLREKNMCYNFLTKLTKNMLKWINLNNIKSYLKNELKISANFIDFSSRSISE